MAVQDDRRENELRELFGLEKPEGEGRGGIDAVLVIDEKAIPFELKSTSKGSVTTVRDFGLDHIMKWKCKHWIIGIYDDEGDNLQYCVYASPKYMEPWIREKEEYILTDFELARLVPSRVTLDMVYEILGKKTLYTKEDAYKIQKKQYSTQEYKAKMDKPNGYTPGRMLEILQDRCRYVIERGSTLNNPHIPESYFRNCEHIIKNHAQRLRELVVKALATETATL